MFSELSNKNNAPIERVSAILLESCFIEVIHLRSMHNLNLSRKKLESV